MKVLFSLKHFLKWPLNTRNGLEKQFWNLKRRWRRYTMEQIRHRLSDSHNATKWNGDRKCQSNIKCYKLCLWHSLKYSKNKQLVSASLIVLSYSMMLMSSFFHIFGLSKIPGPFVLHQTRTVRTGLGYLFGSISPKKFELKGHTRLNRMAFLKIQLKLKNQFWKLIKR